jgi:hypothetical protein
VAGRKGAGVKPPRQVPMPWDRAFEPGPDKNLDLASDDFDLTSLPPDCVAIPLENGGYALVDEEDACRVDEHKWYKSYSKGGRTWYVNTYSIINGKRYWRSMHRLLFGLDHGDRITVDHKNHDGLDNRRSTNLRLASTVQNSANVRKLAKFTSKYRGVSWNSSAEKWLVQITRTCGGVRKRFRIGSFTTEAEAAFAFQVAAPLLKDPDFLQFEEIPKADLPDTERLEEIRRDAIAKVKAILAGHKGNLNAKSSYYGVSWHPHTKKWESGLKFGDIRRVRLGLYDTEKEAAYAHDCSVQILKLTNRKMNKVNRDELGDPGRADEIRKEVTLRLDALRTGQKVGLKASSMYRGVSRSTNSDRWISTITTNNKNYYLGSYKSEIEAAVAFNIAIPILNVPRFVPNPIPDEDMPSPEAMDLIRRNVANKLMVTKWTSL